MEIQGTGAAGSYGRLPEIQRPGRPEGLREHEVREEPLQKRAEDLTGRPLQRETEDFAGRSLQRETPDLKTMAESLGNLRDFTVIGRDRDINLLDMEAAVSAMKKDEILQEYQYFVDHSGNEGRL